MNSGNHTVNRLQNKIVNADKALNVSITIWFIVAVIGQWMFAYYVAIFYGGSAMKGNFSKWNEILTGGHVPGERMGNLAVGIHLLLAVIITVGGPLQLIPQVRNYAKSFHRWNGRVYIVTAIVISISGLIMIWTRGTVGDVFQHIGTSVNAILIIICATLAWKYAMNLDFQRHRRWALRLFLVVSGVWFFRVGLMFWIFINGGPVGFNSETFKGPFLTFLAFAQYLLPLIVLELYLRTQSSVNVSSRYVVTTLVFMLTLAMGLGIFIATMGMWLPRI